MNSVLEFFLKTVSAVFLLAERKIFRVIQSSGNANSVLDNAGCLDSDDELTKAVRDPTTQ